MREIGKDGFCPSVVRFVGSYDGRMLRGREYPGMKSRRSDGFVLCTGGKATYLTDGREYSVSEGCLVFLSEYSSYVMHIEEDFSYILINVELERKDKEVFRLFVTEPSDVKPLMVRAGRLAISLTPEKQIECLSIAYRVYHEVLKAKSVPYIDSSRRLLAEEIARRMSEQYADPRLTVASLARAAKVSEVTLRKLFYGSFGVSPSVYLMKIRLSHALERMKYSDLSFEEIAVSCGYADGYYFSRVFKRTYGLPPGKYRREVLKREKLPEPP